MLIFSVVHRFSFSPEFVMANIGEALTFLPHNKIQGCASYIVVLTEILLFQQVDNTSSDVEGYICLKGLSQNPYDLFGDFEQFPKIC
jgi:hypothetical protein